MNNWANWGELLMEFNLTISIIMVVIGSISIFLSEKIINNDVEENKEDIWEISKKDRKIRMKIGGVIFLIYGLLYIIYWLLKYVF